MGLVWDKQPASKVLRTQSLTYTSTTSTVLTTVFSPQTYQVRVFSQIAGYCIIGDAAQVSASSLTSAGIATGATSVAFPIPASTVGGEYFQCAPGQVFAFSSTSSATGAVSVTEMT
jgi:hypothetical protein